MAWTLVKWIDENRHSVIPSSWIVEPTMLELETSDFPVAGSCYWKKKTSVYDTQILQLSDNKSELQEKMTAYQNAARDSHSDDELNSVASENDANKENCLEDTSRLGAKEESVVLKSIARKRKAEEKIQKQAKKKAEIAAVNNLAKSIFQFHDVQASCDKCEELKTQLQEKESVIIKLQDELKEQGKIQRKCQVAPIPSSDTLRFFKDLVEFYDCNPCPDDPQFCEYMYETKKQKIKESRSIQIKHSKDVPTIVASKKATPSVGVSMPSPKNTDNNGTTSMDKQVKSELALPTITSGNYKYTITTEDLKLEQQAFETGEGKKELVDGFGVYVKYVELEQAEQCSKNTATGLMRALIGLWYPKARLAACSANSGINNAIRTAVFKYCELKYNCTTDKLKRDLTSKCGEERRKISKQINDSEMEVF